MKISKNYFNNKGVPKVKSLINVSLDILVMGVLLFLNHNHYAPHTSKTATAASNRLDFVKDFIKDIGIEPACESLDNLFNECLGNVNEDEFDAKYFSNLHYDIMRIKKLLVQLEKEVDYV